MVNLKFWQNVVVRRPGEDKLKHVMRVSRKELRYFLRIHHIAEEMSELVKIAIANEGATGDISKELRSNRDNEKLRKRLDQRRGRDDWNIRNINKLLKMLKRFEVREQLMASVSKLGDALQRLFNEISHKGSNQSITTVQRKLEDITNRMKVFEGNILLETKQDLTTSVENKNWRVAETTLRQILNNVAAFAQLDRELERHLEGVDQLLQRGQQAQRVRP